MKQLKKQFALLLLGLSLVLANSSSHAFTLLNSYWFDGRTTFRVNFPAGTTDQVLFSGAFQDAISAWNTSSNFIYDSDNSAAPADPCPDDGVNNIAFTSDVCGDAFGGGTLAVALTTSISGASQRSIILFNDSVSWDVFNGTRANSSIFDLRRVAVHELGHSLGLDHSAENAIMFATFRDDIETPQADDLAGVDARYDVDADDIGLAIDNCPDRANPTQSDIDMNNVGDLCDSDADGDGVYNNQFVDQSYQFDNIDSVSVRSFNFGVNSISGILSLAQTFEIGAESTLDSITIPVFNCQSGTLSIEIRALDGENPSDAANDVFQSADTQITFTGVQTELLTVDLPEQEYAAGQRLALVAEHTNVCGWRSSDSSSAPDYPLGSSRFIPTTVPDSWFSLAASNGDGDLPFQTQATPINPDNCPANSNLNQADSDANDVGDVCEGIFGDQDGDSVIDGSDNCPTVPNIQQNDSDGNGTGDFCEGLAMDEVEEVCAPILTSSGNVTLICF